ncbi:AAC(3) family N-acetyltransferase [Actinoplanes sp. NPDC051851]|uniref:aminoglycoside N(3)-acetyltransferase n=1 Tax=Actinoplanes sp. NPDC051851 TaxID=3154753 RepID=UPI00341220DB
MASVPFHDDGERLAADLNGLGLDGVPGMLVHVSMRSVGPVAGGCATLLRAIRDAAGEQATLVVPTHTANNSTTSRSHLAATAGLSPEGLRDYLAGLPGFDPDTTPSYRMGAFAEHVRTHPDALRSAHPQTSFTALGPGAHAWTTVHALDSHLGEESPIGALYDAGAHVLMIGTDFTACTAFHLAEYRLADPPPKREYRCFVQGPDGRDELSFFEIHLDDTDFLELGAAFAADPSVRRGRIGGAEALSFPLRRAVDFAVTWMSAHRDTGTAGR